MVAAIKSPSPASSPAAVESVVWTDDLAREHGFEPLRVEGRLPANLRGTLYRNGPGQYGQLGTRYSHPFEADGAATAIRIADGAATGASRIHRSAGLVEERAAGKILYGLSAPWHRRIANNLRGKFKNTANTSVIVWQDRVFALMEAGRPTEIDPRDLSTIGETDLGVIKAMFSAHPHRVASRKAMYNFGLEYGRVTKLHMYELPDAGPARHLGAVQLSGAPMLHDFIATDTHLVFFVSPTRVAVPRMLLALGTFDQLFRWKPELGTEVICVPIDRPTEVLKLTTDAFYQWHFANAFNRANELVIDYVRYPNFDSFYDIGAVGAGAKRAVLANGVLHRATIDLAARTLKSEPLSDRSCEFPTIAPGQEGREQTMTYLAFDDLTAIGSIDPRGKISSHALSAGERASEPLFVDGHLLVLCHQHGAAYLGVYDAARISDGPTAKIWIDHHVPITFHGTFAKH
jgi:all-trans-8'-apo-beta-carotenal 15,15'-oxygenase